VSNFDDSRVVTAAKIQKALNIGNLNGVKRLAKFVCCDSVYPERILRACEEQRLEMFLRQIKVKLNDTRAGK
jgi:hypothetical protein